MFVPDNATKVLKFHTERGEALRPSWVNPFPVPFFNVFKWQFENTIILHSPFSIFNSPGRGGARLLRRFFRKLWIFPLICAIMGAEGIQIYGIYHGKGARLFPRWRVGLKIRQFEKSCHFLPLFRVIV